MKSGKKEIKKGGSVRKRNIDFKIKREKKLRPKEIQKYNMMFYKHSNKILDILI